MVYWITGRGKSGKTTLARRIAAQTGAVVLGGEDLRKYFPESYDEAGRQRNLERLTYFAKILEDQGKDVVIHCQSPMYLVRKELQAKFNRCLEIELPFGNNDAWEGVQYEESPPYPEEDYDSA